MDQHDDSVVDLVTAVLGEAGGMRALRVLTPVGPLPVVAAGCVSRAAFAAALNMILFAELLDRVPTGAAYVRDVEASGADHVFDHGALRTVRFATGTTGALPAGAAAFARILEPLGYCVAGVYPLPRLRMTGRAYCHLDAPQTMPQFFVSELHVDRFDAGFAAAAHRVFDSARDPLDAAARAVLDAFAATGQADRAAALAALPVILSAFDRQHDRPMLDDYRALLAQSAEAAWIATEGNAFNHATDRVVDVDAVAAAQQALGRPMKDRVEISASGRVRQTAFHADQVERRFGVAQGEDIVLTVPGSFYEFISRDIDPATGTLDLAFDSGNASGIFGMTAAKAA